MPPPPRNKHRVEIPRSKFSQIMDELMDEDSFPAFPAGQPTKPTTSKGTPSRIPVRAVPLNTSTTPPTASPASPAEAAVPAKAEEAEDAEEAEEAKETPILAPPQNCGKIYHRHPTSCGNERWMKNAGFYKNCLNVGKEVCPTCGLIEYCSEKCRFEHLNTHAPFCNPAYASERWAPDLRSLEKEKAAEEGKKKLIEKDKVAEEGKKNMIRVNTGIWGNIAAFDILCLESPAAYTEDINVLLPISGDLRNAIVTINAIPYHYSKVCDLTLNDPNSAIVIRNALMLMIIFVYPDKFEAVKCIIQLWYSAFLSSTAFKKLKYELLPFISRAYAKNKSGKPGSQVSQRWTKGSASLRLTLTRRQWKGMMEMLEHGDEIDFNKASTSRRAVLDKEKLSRNKQLFDMLAVHRRSQMRYLTTGMLLPFGQPIGQYDMPNPTLFSSEGEYLNTADSTPLDAWYLDEVLESGKKFSVLEHDIFHALYQHVGKTLFEFCFRLSDSKLKVNFHLYSVETKKLDGTLGNNKAHHVNGLNFLQMGSYDGDYVEVKGQ